MLVTDSAEIYQQKARFTPRYAKSTLFSVLPKSPREIVVSALREQCNSPSAQRALWGCLQTLPSQQQQELISSAITSLKAELNQALQSGNQAILALAGTNSDYSVCRGLRMHGVTAAALKR